MTFVFAAGNIGDGLVDVGVEFRANAGHSRDAVTGEGGHEVFLGQLNPLDQVLGIITQGRLIRAVQRLQGAGEIIIDRQHIIGETFNAECARGSNFTLGAAFGVFRIGQRAQGLVFQRRKFQLKFFDPRDGGGPCIRFWRVVSPGKISRFSGT